MNTLVLMKLSLAAAIPGCVSAPGLAIAGYGHPVYWAVAAGFAVSGSALFLRIRK